MAEDEKNKEPIDETNFFVFTEGHFEPCEVPDREPDFVSKGKHGKRDMSSYWYEGDSLIRQSNHWGTRIASCTWSLGDEPIEPSWKNMKLGQRAGTIKWEDLKTPDVEIKVFSPFGELDPDKIGYDPVPFPDDEQHNYTLFKLDRSMFEADNYRFSIAGTTIEYRGYPSCFVTADGSAYSDPQASAAADAWAAERARAKKAAEPRPALGAWIASETENPAFSELAKRMTNDRLATGQLVETEIGLLSINHPGDLQKSAEEIWSTVLENIDEESRLTNQVNGFAPGMFAPDILKTLEKIMGKSNILPLPAILSENEKDQAVTYKNVYVDIQQMTQDLKTYVKGQVSGRGDGICPMESFEACAAEVKRLAPAAGEEGKQVLAELGKLEQQWKAAGHTCTAGTEESTREVARADVK